MFCCSTLHGGIYSYSLCTKITSISEHNFTFSRWINLIVMQLFSGSLYFTYLAVIDIGFLVQLMTEMRFISFFGPGSISAMSSRGGSFFRLFGSSRISLDECGILNRSTLYVSTASRLSRTAVSDTCNPMASNCL